MLQAHSCRVCGELFESGTRWAHPPPASCCRALLSAMALLAKVAVPLRLLVAVLLRLLVAVLFLPSSGTLERIYCEAPAAP